MESSVPVNGGTEEDHIPLGASVSNSLRNWKLCGNTTLPKREIVFFVQVILVYIVAITALVNITLGATQELWVVLLTSSLGYMLPAPSLSHTVSDRRHQQDNNHGST